MLLGAVFMQNVGRIVENRSAGEDGEQHAEACAQVEQPEHAKHDSAHYQHARNPKNRAQERKVLASQEDAGSKNTENRQRSNSLNQNWAVTMPADRDREMICDPQKRAEDNRKRDDIG